jgi:RNA polymerase sigma-70 factor (ECF subfamily)
MDAIADDPHAHSPQAIASSADRDTAFAALVDRHATLMYRVAFALLRNPSDAEDAVQETLLKLYRGEAWRAMLDEKAFLARSVWRVGLNRLGTQGARALRNATDIAQLHLASPAQTPEQHAVGTAEHNLLHQLIEELPEGFRQALTLSAIDGLRSQQVAELLGINEATVRTRVLRAKADLRQRFLDRTATRSPNANRGPR